MYITHPVHHYLQPLTAPIQVVDFPNVPLELQQDSRYLSASSRHSSLQQAERRRRRALTNPVPFSFSKVRKQLYYSG